MVRPVAKKPKLTSKQIKLGAEALKQYRAGENPPSWVSDEDTWEKAKEAALKTYDEGDDYFWAAVTSIYENMGGEVGAVAPSDPNTVGAAGSSDGNRKAWQTRKAISYGEKSESADAHSKVAQAASARADTEGTAEAHGAAALEHSAAMDKHGIAHDYAPEEKRDGHMEKAGEHEKAMKEHLRKAGKLRFATMASAVADEPGTVHSRSSSVEFKTDDPPKEFMWMPGGVNTIEATWNGKPIRMTVECDSKTSETVNASLSRWRERYPKQKPFACVEHREQEAALWPSRFDWKDDPEPGVFCSVESWSDLGDRNVRGRIHRSFSPSFSTDAEYDKAREDAEGVVEFPQGVRGSESNPARVTGVAFSIGSLTNKPAFRNILPVRASQANPQPATQPNADNKTGVTMRVKLVKARGQTVAGTVMDLKDDEAVKAIADGDAISEREAQAIEARDSEIAAMKKERFEQQQNIVRAKISDAKARGAIPPQDEAIQAKMLGRLDKGADIELIVELIDALQPKTQQQALASRTTTSDDGGNRPVIATKPSLAEGLLAYCNTRQHMDKVIRAGDFKAAFEMSRESAAILSSHVKPIIATGGDFRPKDVIRAADVTDGNLGTLSTGLILMRNLGFLKAKLVWLPYVSTDLRNEPALFGQPVFTRYIVPPDVVDFNTSTGWSASTAKSTDVTVTMEKHQGVEIRFQTQMLGSTIRNLFAEQQGAQFYSLALKINRYFIDKILSATWAPTLIDGTTAVGPYVKALADWDIKSLVGVKNKMTLATIEDMGRFVILHSTYHDKLLEDSNLVLARTIQSALNQGESDALTEGTLPMLFGIQPLESQLMTDDESYDGISNTPDHVGFAGNVSSMLFVARVPQDYTKIFGDIPATAAIEIVTEPDSGLSVMLVRYVNHQLANVSARVALMYGAAQGDPRRGFTIDPA